MKTPQMHGYRVAAIAGLVAAFGVSANAQTLEHYYYGASGDITVDQVGSANGTLNGSATLSSGNLVTTGAGSAMTGGVAQNAMTLSTAAVSGITGAFTIVDWFACVPSSGNGTHLFNFSNGTSANMLTALPADGTKNGGSLFYPAHAYSGVAGSYTDIFDSNYSPQYLDNGGALFQMVVTYDGTSLQMYVDGQVQPAATVTGGSLNLSSLSAIGVAGGSPWGADPSLHGTTYAFDIFNGALSSSQISSLYSAGDSITASQVIAAVPEPATLTLSGLGGLALLMLRQRSKR